VKPALADRLSRALVGCYPHRWKQRYAAEMLDVLDQHRTGSRTVLSLAGGALTTHLDPGYRMEIRLMPHLSKDVKLALVLFAAVAAVLLAVVAPPVIAQNIRESSWHPSNSGAVGSVASPPAPASWPAPGTQAGQAARSTRAIPAAQPPPTQSASPRTAMP
jgi:hypothetical protein